MSAFAVEKRTEPAGVKGVATEEGAPNTFAGKATGGSEKDSMVIDIEDDTAEPTVAKADGAKAPSDGAAGAEGKTCSAGKKRSAGECSSGKKTEGKIKNPEAGMRTLDMFLKGGSSNKKAKTDDTPPVKENLPPPIRLEMPTGSAKEAQEPAHESDIMVVDEEEHSKKVTEAQAAARQKMVATVKPASDTKPAEVPAASAPADTAPKPAEGSDKPKPAPKASGSAPKKPKAVTMSPEEQEKRLKLLHEELSLLAMMQVHGDHIPFLRGGEDDEVDFELDGVEEGEVVLPAKTKQSIARSIEGSSKTARELAEWLRGSQAAFKGIDVDSGSDLECYERAIEAVADYEDGFSVQEGSSASDDGAPTFQKVWMVKDVADIPQEFRAIVDAHRKLGSSIKERATLATKIVSEIKEGAGKELPKLERVLLSVKDRHVKLEEKEKSEREKFKSKVEVEKKRAAERLEKLQRREEEAKKKEEEAVKRKEKKEEELKAREEREAKRADESAERQAKATDKEKDADVKDAKHKGAPKKAKALPAGNAQQASFMSNFFKKPAAGALPSKHVEAASTGVSPAKAASSSSASSDPSKPHANFRGWEDPAHSTVAGFPYGPKGAAHGCGEQPPPSIDGWVSKWKGIKQRPAIVRPMRDDGTLHPKMKLIHIHMRLAVVNTQLLDVDVDAVKKVIWDVEEHSEEQLQAILAAAVQDEEGLYHWEGKTLQFATEGGGYFDCRRPPFFGTHTKRSEKFSARNPLGQDAELDYDYESDRDWESETGEGEDLMSDLGDEEEEEEEEEGESGFVVADGEWDSGIDGVSSRKKVGKLHQVIYDGMSMPEEMADAFAIRVTSELPLMLSRDHNLHLDKGVDYTGGDLSSFRAVDLEAVMIGVHKHPTACAFTWVDPSSDNKYAGICFLKTAESAEDKHPDQEHLLSGHLKKIPHWKKDAIAREKQLAFAAEMERQRLAAIAAAEKAAAAKKAQRSTSALQKKPIEDTLSEDHLKAFVMSVHGKPGGKPQLVELVHKACELTKAVSSALVSRVAEKKDHRWRVNAPFLEKKNLLEASEQAWEANSKEPIPARPSKATDDAADHEEEAAGGEEAV